MDVVKRFERGWAGHFICADRCLFHLNTLLVYNKKRIVVSTVGRMRKLLPQNDKIEFEEIGFNRYYETMAFRARKEGLYWDADVMKEIFFNSEWAIDNVGENSENEANIMHENVVMEITKKLIKGEL